MKRLQKRIKRPLCALCAFLAVFFGVGNAYTTAVHAEAVTTAYTTFQIVEGILASLGVFQYIPEMANASSDLANVASWTGWADIYNNMGTYYDNAVSAGQMGWDETIDYFKSVGKIDWSNAGVFDVMKNWYDTTYTDAYNLGASISDFINPDTSKYYAELMTNDIFRQAIKDYKYWYIQYVYGDVRYNFYSNIGRTSDSNSLYCGGYGFGTVNGVVPDPCNTSIYKITEHTSGLYVIAMSAVPSFANYTEFKNWVNQSEEISQYQGDIGAWTPNEVGADLPAVNIPEVANDIPLLQDIADLLGKVIANDDTGNPAVATDAVPDAVKEYLDGLAIPTTKPGEGEGEGVKETEATKPGENESEKITEVNPALDTEVADSGFLGTGLSNVFPFCIPWDLVKAFKLFAAPAEAPHITWNFKVDRIGLDYTFDIDFSMFETVAAIFRTLETIGFIIALILVTNKLIKH